VAMDRDGNIGLGFSVSSSTMHPGIHFTGHRVTDPLGQMGQGEGVIIDGKGSQLDFPRWGDYTSLSIDPADDCTFWYTDQYYGVDGNSWQTRTGTFKLSECQTGTPKLTSVGAAQTAFEGGSTVVGTVLLSNFAPAGGVVVKLSSSKTSLVKVPASVTVPAGKSSATFAITSVKTSTQTSVTLKATLGSTSKSVTLTVLASPAPSAVTFNPPTVPAGGTSIGTVTLDGPAPSSGAVVTLSSDLPTSAQVPASVTIPAGATQRTFTVTTSINAFAPDAVAISASYHGITRTGFLNIARNLPMGNAVFDADLRAPACRSVQASCDTGGLIDGRDGLGPELNQPNTIFAACADGSDGVYRSARTIDGLRITSVDGSPLAPGKTARIDLTVFACNCDGSGQPDFFALYVARDASNPAWAPIAILSAPAPGRQVLSTTFTLPTGRLEAVRASISFTSFGEVCSAGGTTNFGDLESDDLVFAVQNPGPDVAYAWPEAEAGTFASPLVLVDDFFASAGHAVRVPAGVDSLTAPPADGHLTLPFTVAVPGSYAIWGRVIAPSSTQASFWLRVDGGPFIRWDDIAVGSTYHWDRVRDSDAGGPPALFTLAAGDHVVELAYREGGITLDRLLVTNDPLEDPTHPSGVQGPPPPPTGLLAFPSNQAVTLFWSSSGFQASEFKVRRGTMPGGPYPARFESDSTSFRDDTVTNGTTYCYIVQGSNADGDSPPSPEICATPVAP
jgi:hypothetical protein